MLRLCTALVVALASVNSYALRCGTELVYDGDTQAQVLSKCGSPESRYQGGILSDEVYYTYNQDGMNYEIKFFKNHVVEINQSR